MIGRASVFQKLAVLYKAELCIGAGDRQESLMGRRLYVGNLAWGVTDQDLQEAFGEAGKVESSQVIIDRATNRSRGFGFVEMATDEAADDAIKKLNGRDLKGRAIRVNEAQARTAGGGGGGGGERRGGMGGGRDRDR
jgi:RNA recognition motif-containing protein